MKTPVRITVYGIPHCESVKKARAWLEQQGLAYAFHDFKKQGVPEERLDRWLERAGHERLVNRKGTTWRKLDPSVQAAVTDSDSARSLMLDHSSVIKRPVIEWGEGPRAALTVGHDPAAFAQAIGAGG